MKCIVCKNKETEIKNKCKTCYYREYMRENSYKYRDDNKKRCKEYRKKNKKRLKEYDQSPRKKEKQRIIASTKRKYPITNQKCKYCKNKAEEHHHNTLPYKIDKFDYVCKKHHNLIHRKNAIKHYEENGI